MTVRGAPWSATWTAVRGASAVGFILCLWIRTFCNLPFLCESLELAVPVFALLYLSMCVATARALHAPVLGRYGAALLAATAAVALLFDLVDAFAPDLFWRRTMLVGVLERLSWVWILVAGLAVSRWIWGWLPPAESRETPERGMRRVAATTVIVVVIGLQAWVLYRPGPSLWPFTDYELYTSAHGSPVRAVHYKVYATPAATPDVEIEIPSESLEMRWFPYHTQFVPQLFHTPGQVLEEFHRRLDASDLPALREVVAEQKTYHLEGSDLDTHVERRQIPLKEGRQGQR